MRTSIVPPYRLTDEQNNVLRVTEKGHNVSITGQGETVKSFLVGEVFSSLESKPRKKVSIICSSGIATTVYDDLSTYVKTVHAHYGLQTAELPSDLPFNDHCPTILCRKGYAL